jgi:hypothetical protein
LSPRGIINIIQDHAIVDDGHLGYQSLHPSFLRIDLEAGTANRPTCTQMIWEGAGVDSHVHFTSRPTTADEDKDIEEHVQE